MAANRVIVHQVGRVGSTSLWKALLAHPELGEHRVASTHRLSDQSFRWWVWAIGLGQAKAGSLFPMTELARSWLTDPRQTLHVITPVRDPVARNLSKYFFERGRGMASAEPEIAGHSVQQAIEHFYWSLDHREPLRWFDEEVRGPLGIDVLREHTGAGAYDPGAGHGVIESAATATTPRVRMLLLDADMADERKASLVAGFLGIEAFEIPRLNAVTDPAVSAGGDRALYRRVLGEGVLMPEYLDWMYESRFAKRFFTADQIGGLRAKWSGGARTTTCTTAA